EYWERAKGAAALPHDVMTGHVNPRSDEGFQRVMDLAGGVVTGGMPAGRAMGAAERTGAKGAGAAEKAAPAAAKDATGLTLKRAADTTAGQHDYDLIGPKGDTVGSMDVVPNPK